MNWEGLDYAEFHDIFIDHLYDAIRIIKRGGKQPLEFERAAYELLLKNPDGVSAEEYVEILFAFRSVWVEKNRSGLEQGITRDAHCILGFLV